jgi:hypothetical protein
MPQHVIKLRDTSLNNGWKVPTNDHSFTRQDADDTVPKWSGSGNFQ